MEFSLLGQARRDLAELHELEQNYELSGPATEEAGWTVDQYAQRLPRGSFEVAKRLLRDYEFADPAIIKAVWLPDSPLDQRDMLLEGRFLFLRFVLAVRVNKVLDEVTDAGERTWGWCYTTLQGHFEAGEMCYRVEEDADGNVCFKVNRFVRTGRIPNLVIRLGWMTFGRFMQVLFVRRSMARMKRLVETELTSTAPRVPLAGEEIAVARLSERPAS